MPVKGRIFLMYFNALTVKGRPTLQYIFPCVIVILTDDGWNTRLERAVEDK